MNVFAGVFLAIVGALLYALVIVLLRDGGYYALSWLIIALPAVLVCIAFISESLDRRKARMHIPTNKRGIQKTLRQLAMGQNDPVSHSNIERFVTLIYRTPDLFKDTDAVGLLSKLLKNFNAEFRAASAEVLIKYYPDYARTNATMIIDELLQGCEKSTLLKYDRAAVSLAAKLDKNYAAPRLLTLCSNGKLQDCTDLLCEISSQSEVTSALVQSFSRGHIASIAPLIRLGGDMGADLIRDHARSITAYKLVDEKRIKLIDALGDIGNVQSAELLIDCIQADTKDRKYGDGSVAPVWVLNSWHFEARVKAAMALRRILERISIRSLQLECVKKLSQTTDPSFEETNDDKPREWIRPPEKHGLADLRSIATTELQRRGIPLEGDA